MSTITYYVQLIPIAYYYSLLNYKIIIHFKLFSNLIYKKQINLNIYHFAMSKFRNIFWIMVGMVSCMEKHHVQLKNWKKKKPE